MSSSLLGHSQECKFHPVKIDSKIPVTKSEAQSYIYPINSNLPNTKKSNLAHFNPTMVPLTNRGDINLSYLSNAPADFEEFKLSIDKCSEMSNPNQKINYKEVNKTPMFENIPKLIEENNDLFENEKEELNLIYNAKIRKLNPRQKIHSVGKYINKKEKRKSPAYIRYKIRQDLAGQRVRNKGKFVRNQRLDLKKLAEEYMRGFLKRTSIGCRLQKSKYLLNFFKKYQIKISNFYQFKCHN